MVMKLEPSVVPDDRNQSASQKVCILSYRVQKQRDDDDAF
jgi:hypothetical protein